MFTKVGKAVFTWGKIDEFQGTFYESYVGSFDKKLHISNFFRKFLFPGHDIWTLVLILFTKSAYFNRFCLIIT